MPSDFSRWLFIYSALIFLSKLSIGLGSMSYFARTSGADFEVLEKFGQSLPAPLKLVYGFKNDIPSFSDWAGREVALCVLGMLVSMPFLGSATYEFFLNSHSAERISAGLFVVVEVATLLYFLNLGKRIKNLEKLQWQQIQEQEKAKHKIVED